MASSHMTEQIVLSGKYVQLEPLTEAHIPALQEVGLDAEIWRHMPYGDISTADQLGSWVRSLLVLAENGADIPFAVVHKPTGRVAGATRYMDVRPVHRGLEIGGTWYGAVYRRTAVNTETKYLLLQHAFEAMHCIRVQFKTDSRNERSQRAIERIGAVREGILRNHMILPDGTVRHSVYYSILDSEWPDVKERLHGLLAR